MIRYILTCCLVCLLLCQCDSLRSDCAAVAAREAESARETPGDYYIGRRYYVPLTRFWGYLRRPGESWSTAKLVIMDETDVRTPDRGYEPPVAGATFGKDANVEYFVYGRYTGEQAYDPSTDQALPVFRSQRFSVRNRKPGFLFVPSEQYSEAYVTLRPSLLPNPAQCQALQRR